VFFLGDRAYKLGVDQEARFFKSLGARVKRLREEAGYSQEDMISQGYSVRYWQKVEAGKPITLRTLLRICNIFSAPMHQIVRGLDEIKGAQRMPVRRSRRKAST
jgi:transcriptional regulator with XRE-family HTH domain